MKPSILVDDSDPWLGSERLHRNLFWLSDGRKFPQCVGIVRLETNCRTQPAGGIKNQFEQHANMLRCQLCACMACMYVYIYMYTSVYIHISYHMPLYVSNNFNSIHHPTRWEKTAGFWILQSSCKCKYQLLGCIKYYSTFQVLFTVHPSKWLTIWERQDRQDSMIQNYRSQIWMVLDRNGSTCFQSGLKSIDILLVNVSIQKNWPHKHLRKGDDIYEREMILNYSL